MCLYPRTIRNPKYKPNKKNGGIIPVEMDSNLLSIEIPCGECWECRRQKANGWKVRLNEEARTWKNAKFITLTWDEEAMERCVKRTKIKDVVERDRAICAKEIRLWLERTRKQTGKSTKHWLINEKGHNGTKRLHMHGIIWGENTNEAIKKWNNGWVYEGTFVNEQTINYIVKYVTKNDDINDDYKGFILASPGIGNNYTKRPDSKGNKYNEENTKECYTMRNGRKMNLPTYYKRKIYSDEEREFLRLYREYKGEHWVCGEKTDSIEKKQKLIEFYRKIHQKEGVPKWWKEPEKKNYSSEEVYAISKENCINNDMKVIIEEYEKPFDWRCGIWHEEKNQQKRTNSLLEMNKSTEEIIDRFNNDNNSIECPF